MSNLTKGLKAIIGPEYYAKARDSSLGRKAMSLMSSRADKERTDWVHNAYHAHGRRQRIEIFLGIARFAHINRPIKGYYMEFGCHEAKTMRYAWENFRHLFDWQYVAFDSFEGLPEMGPEERSEIFKAGNLATSTEEFRSIMHRAGMPSDKLILVKGFYEQSLTNDLVAKLAPKKAAVVYIDCDLYSSTQSVLRFIKPFLQVGTVVVFDDWYCYHGDPNKGEQRAWREFAEENPDVAFVEFVRTCEAHTFIITNPGNGQ